jgi:glyceraldehyde 3-phosphate dehydrogenase
LELTAVNDLVPAEQLAYLLKYDTAYGTYEPSVEAASDALVVQDKRYKLFNKKDPSEIPWGDLDVEIVFECTGVFRGKEDVKKHLEAGARTVILSAPSKDEDMVTVVHGVNKPDEEVRMFSCASCTTNAITPVAEVMSRRFGVKKAIMTTVHGYTSTQGLVDGPNKKMRRGRAAAANMVPTSTGAAKATGLALPQFKGKFDGVAVRTPVITGSIADVVFLTEKSTSVEEVNDVFTEEAGTERYQGVLGITTDPLVSSDVIGDPRASIVDLEMTRVVDGDLVKIMAWYDNEWGYASQMVREAERIAKEES